MSVQQKAGALRQKIDDLLVEGVNIAVPILKVVNATADWCPPLKMATGAALSILDEVKKFKDNKQEWSGFGKYVVDTVAEVVSAIKSYDASAEEAKPWVESVTKLDGHALQKIKSEIERRLKKVEKRPAVLNVVSYLRDPGRIDGLKKDFDKALVSFQLRTNLIGGAKLAAIERRLQDDKILDSLQYPHIAHDDFTHACLEGTRIDLTELAGRCASEGDVTLLLHFFFKAGERSRPDFLFSGIARTLADHDPVYRTFIISALRKDPSLSTALLATQFENLVALPLLHKPPPPDRPMVVIIDALDECDKEVFESFADILREEVPKLPSSIKFFITSRHTDLVRRSLSPQFPISRLAIDLSDNTNVQDCATYIRFELQKLKNWHPDLRHYLQDEDKTVQEILERASGLFIWISTIFRYMRTANKDPMRTLEGLLNTGTKRSKVPAEGMMDRLYTSILKKCDWEDEDFSHDYPIVMGAIFIAQRPLSITAWDAILSPFLKSPVRYSLAELAPLLSGVEDSHFPVRILHQSFRDFIVDRIVPLSINPCCIPVDVGTENARVALRCIEILNQDLCSVKGLGLIENLPEKGELPLIPLEESSEHSHYACRYIVHHLSGVQEPSPELDESVGVFLSEQATRWVEACVRMEGYINISLLPEWAKLAVGHRSKGAVRVLASMLVQLVRNLNFFSRFQEAYEAATDSVALCRYLVSVDSGSYSPDLATSLNNLYLALSKLGRHSEALPFIEEIWPCHSTIYICSFNLGRHSEALPFIEESVRLRRQLVAVHPGSYTPDLAISLNNLHSALSKLGRHSEALPFIEESIWPCHSTIYISLFNLGRHSEALPFIEESIWPCHSTIYICSFQLGRHSEALPFIEESVRLRRQLVAVHPGSYTPDLAISLNNLYSALSKLGRHSEALPFIEESVRLRRQLVAVHPGSYTPDLAMSLNNLYSALSGLGRHSEALPFIEESVRLQRQLVAVHPGSYTPDLAMSLNNLYSALFNLGRHSEALPFIEESVSLYASCCSSSGIIHPNLATSLNNLYFALSKLGRHSEALPFIEESVRLRRQLVAVHPGSYTPDLATSLNNLYLALSNSDGTRRHSHSLKKVFGHVTQQSIFCSFRLGRHSEALPFIEESVRLQRQLVTVHPGSYTPNLATSLNNLYFALSKLGRHSEALPFIEESVKLRRQLVEINPGAYTPQLANSLRNLRNALSSLGRHSEAQMVHS
ncbi:uncharacterized protein EI90DRAFT_3118200 [Cantharellus anzutake]|uniref:uncharacterized protein n=1 Tax=Cantharellus anzutake TaxID=1750568 RepID=UPI001908BB09|nr:uncharacterized protein EI90DRAFT_3118200 [Cantharellus anzutake]KAF8339117.1 hypothetical protein EI90DRAFT_3118200 [Cantharellus anzutake]